MGNSSRRGNGAGVGVEGVGRDHWSLDKRETQLRSIKYIYPSVLYFETHRPKKVNRFTKVPNRFKIVYSHEEKNTH